MRNMRVFEDALPVLCHLTQRRNTASKHLWSKRHKIASAPNIMSSSKQSSPGKFCLLEDEGIAHYDVCFLQFFHTMNMNGIFVELYLDGSLPPKVEAKLLYQLIDQYYVPLQSRAIQMLISLPIYDLFNLLMTNIRELVTYYHRGSVSYAKEASTALPSQRNSHLLPLIEAVLQRYRKTQ